ncbi:hypothetical protein JW960_00630 [candidate division KSB1 bacterium]|nr:hypothetical protein [candidate division KSB1 bacterium]
MKRSNYASVIVMTIVLMVIIILMIIVHNLKSPPSLAPLESIQADAGMIKHRYYNKPFRCAVSLPDTNVWGAFFRERVDSVQVGSANVSHPLHLVRLERTEDGMQLAEVKVGVFPVEPSTKLRDFTQQRMTAEVDSLRKAGENVAIIGDVKVVSSMSLAGAFYVLEIAAPTYELLPVWVSMFVPRDGRMFQIMGKVKRARYEMIKDEIEFILVNFQLL